MMIKIFFLKYLKTNFIFIFLKKLSILNKWKKESENMKEQKINRKIIGHLKKELILLFSKNLV